jgi:hypothetical protein
MSFFMEFSLCIHILIYAPICTPTGQFSFNNHHPTGWHPTLPSKQRSLHLRVRHLGTPPAWDPDHDRRVNVIFRRLNLFSPVPKTPPSPFITCCAAGEVAARPRVPKVAFPESVSTQTRPRLSREDHPLLPTPQCLAVPHV